MSARTIIGIDPDTDKSGIGIVSIEPQEEGRGGRRIKVELTSLPFPEAVDHILRLSAEARPDTNLQICVEASWTRTTNWHLSPYDRRARAASKGYDVGRNHETGRKLCEMLRHHGLQVREVAPLRKCWKGRDRKITHEELERVTGGLPKRRTNQEERDALLIAWAFAELPIRF